VRPGGGRPSPGTRVDYETLAALRYQLRRFLHGREAAARAVGVEPQQYLLLLQLKGLEGRAAATVGALAERLQVRHHSAVGLVDRLARRGLVSRERDQRDGRSVVVRLTASGRAVLRRLALKSLAELETEGPALLRVLRKLISRPASRLAGRSGAGGRPSLERPPAPVRRRPDPRG
jgi:DNA-binding MarR family transcriptional regulator